MSEIIFRTCQECEHPLDKAAKDRYDRWRRLAKMPPAPEAWPKLCAICILKAIDGIGRDAGDSQG